MIVSVLVEFGHCLRISFFRAWLIKLNFLMAKLQPTNGHNFINTVVLKSKEIRRGCDISPVYGQIYNSHTNPEKDLPQQLQQNDII